MTQPQPPSRRGDQVACTCPVDAYETEIDMVGGHWYDCPRAIMIANMIDGLIKKSTQSN